MPSLTRLPYTPSSALGSCRYKIKDPDEDDTDYKRILEIFKKYDVRYFCYNGGNDSMDTCNKIIQVYEEGRLRMPRHGHPQDHRQRPLRHRPLPGLSRSAAKYIATSVMEVSRDAHVYDTGMITIIECMGRHAGWLTAACRAGQRQEDALLRLHLPARGQLRHGQVRAPTSQQASMSEKKNCIVAVSEGDALCRRQLRLRSQDRRDRRLRPCPAGRPGCDARQHHERAHLGAKVRGIELSLLQRCAAHVRLRHRYRGSLYRPARRRCRGS